MSKKKAAKPSKKKRGRGPDKKPRRRRAKNPPIKNPNKRGRPQGSKDALPKGAVGAIRALRYRVPDDVPPILANEAGMALEVVSRVLRGQIRQQTMARLSAARIMRDEVCGKLVQSVDVPGLADLGKAIIEARKRKAKKESG